MTVNAVKQVKTKPVYTENASDSACLFGAAIYNGNIKTNDKNCIKIENIASRCKTT